MFKLADLVLIGTVTDTQSRPWRSEATGRSGVSHYVYLVGPRDAYEVQLPDGLVGKFRHGDHVAITVRASTYRDEVQYNAVGVWDGDLGPVKPQPVPVAAGAKV